MYSNEFINQYNAAKSALYMLCHQAYNQGMKQSDILRERERIITGFMVYKKHIPKIHGSTLSAYFDGCYDSVTKRFNSGGCLSNLVFLYTIDGQLYRTNHDKRLNLPVWDTLPREQWGDLGDYGGLYWLHNLKPFSGYGAQ